MIFSDEKLKKLQAYQVKEHKHHILIVDDEVENLDVLQGVLSEEYQITRAGNAQEALSIFNSKLFSNPVDLIISDQRMPQMTGVDFLSEIKQLSPATIRILLTAYTDSQDIIAAINRASIYQFIVKPFDFEALLILVKRALEAYELAKRNVTLVDELKTINLALELNKKNLEATVKERTKELLEANDCLKNSQEQRTQLLAMISHELRTPLTILKSSIEAMSDGIRKPSQENFTILVNEVNQLNRLISDLFSLSVNELHQLDYQYKNIDVVALLRDCLAGSSQKLANNKIQLSLDIHCHFHYIKADAERITQLFHNLINNACAYTQSPGQLKIRVENEGDNIMFDFQDSSPGVKEQDLDKLCTPLYRAEESRNRATGGTGLGLAICEQIVKAHHGTLSIKHSCLGGLRVVLSFPTVN